jgi:hypothetical protein
MKTSDGVEVWRHEFLASARVKINGELLTLHSVPLENFTHYSLNRSLGGHEIRPRYYEEDKNLAPATNRKRFFGRAVDKLLVISTKLF